MNLNVFELLAATLTNIRKNDNISISDTLSSFDAEQHVRKQASALITQATCTSSGKIGQNKSFQIKVLENALQLTVATKYKSACVNDKEKHAHGHMQYIKQKNIQTVAEKKQMLNRNVKKIAIGEIFQTVTVMSIQKTLQEGCCEFQFSRKINRPGIIDIFECTDLIYVGAKNVYKDIISSKRMIFKISSGTDILLNGETIKLNRDIEVAGVLNHVDPNDPYNVNAKKRASLTAEKAKIRAQALERS